MLRLIRNKATRHFLCPDGSWSTDWRAARFFDDTPTLIETASRLNAPNLEELLVLGDAPSEQDIVLPLFRR